MLNLRQKAAVANNSNQAPNLFLNFVKNTSFSIVLKFGAKLSIRIEDISKLRKFYCTCFDFARTLGNLLENCLRLPLPVFYRVTNIMSLSIMIKFGIEIFKE